MTGARVTAGRFWRYERGQWSGRGVYRGGDEYGRRTLVLRLPGERALVFAYRTCRCDECREVLEQTAEWSVRDCVDEQ